MTNKIKVLSGIRASSKGLHLGNLLGAVEGMIELQNNSKYETYYMVADLHGITTHYDPKELQENRLEIAKDYLAAGIDPSKSTLFLQADVPEHAELAFYLSSVVTVNRLKHLPSYKEKIKDYPEDNTVALFNYPVLMAADILLYKGQEVPLGADQVYHLEVAREIARKMNSKYGTDFPEPNRYVVKGKEITIPDLLSSEEDKLPKKMSKSTPEGAIFLNDSFETIKKKIFAIPTSSGGGAVFPEKGGINTIYQMIKVFVSDSRATEFKESYLANDVLYSDFKSELSEAIYKRLKPIQEKREQYDKNPRLVEEILEKGGSKARELAKMTMAEVKKAMGLPQV